MDRTNDMIYSHTIEVVKAITNLSKIVSNNQCHLYIETLRFVGSQLKLLLSAADEFMLEIPSDGRRQVGGVLPVRECLVSLGFYLVFKAYCNYITIDRQEILSPQNIANIMSRLHWTRFYL